MNCYEILRLQYQNPRKVNAAKSRAFQRTLISTAAKNISCPFNFKVWKMAMNNLSMTVLSPKNPD